MRLWLLPISSHWQDVSLSQTDPHPHEILSLTPFLSFQRHFLLKFFNVIFFNRRTFSPPYQGKTRLDFYSVNFLVRWTIGKIRKVGRDVMRILIITDNQDFSYLIIKSFDNQTVSSPWLSRISDTSENQTKRLDSDNEINISTLIRYLVIMNEWVLISTWKKSVWSTRIGRIVPI